MPQGDVSVPWEKEPTVIPLRDDNPTQIKPVLTWGLIAVNVVVFLYQVSLGPRQGQVFVFEFGMIPAVFFGYRELPSYMAAIPSQLSLLTNMFLHGGWLHLIGNMVYLWIFGDNIEAAMGRIRFLVFYLLCGVLASLSHALTDPTSVLPTIGASGAISGVLGAYALLYPRARVLVLLWLGFFTRLMYIPAAIALGFWFLLQLVNGALSSEQGGVAFWAHIGGFVAGLVLVGLFKRRDVRFFNPAQSRPEEIESDVL
jgi:membrane associated rhomboid family serine protease